MPCNQKIKEKYICASFVIPVTAVRAVAGCSPYFQPRQTAVVTTAADAAIRVRAAAVITAAATTVADVTTAVVTADKRRRAALNRSPLNFLYDCITRVFKAKI